VRRLVSLLDLDFTYQKQKGGHRTTAYPDIQLMSLIVVATKLSQPFDSITRYPENESDPSTLQIDWLKWAQTIAKSPSNGLRRGQETLVTDADVSRMTEKQMDDYLDAYQRTWIDDRDPKSMYVHGLRL
jgi:RNA polymerase I-specific transcription initiation factor RRN7